MFLKIDIKMANMIFIADLEGYDINLPNQL